MYECIDCGSKIPHHVCPKHPNFSIKEPGIIMVPRNAEALAEELRLANLKLCELQERYDIYAQHLKSCVVWIAPEIPCDCGFLVENQKSDRCANAENVGPTTLGAPKCNCNWIPHLYDCPVVLAQEPRYCVKCGRRMEAADAAHVWTCEGKGNAANPAPFID